MRNSVCSTPPPPKSEATFSLMRKMLPSLALPAPAQRLSPPPPKNGPTPMDIDHMCGKGNPVVMCFCCWQPGHYCQGKTCFPLQSSLGVLPTPTSDTFGICQTPTTSEFQRHFELLVIPSPFQQAPMQLHVPSTPTSCLTPLPKAAPRPLPPPKVTQRLLWILHPPIQSPLRHSSETLQAMMELGQLL